MPLFWNAPNDAPNFLWLHVGQFTKRVKWKKRSRDLKGQMWYYFGTFSWPTWKNRGYSFSTKLIHFSAFPSFSSKVSGLTQSAGGLRSRHRNVDFTNKTRNFVEKMISALTNNCAPLPQQQPVVDDVVDDGWCSRMVLDSMKSCGWAILGGEKPLPHSGVAIPLLPCHCKAPTFWAGPALIRLLLLLLL